MDRLLQFRSHLAPTSVDEGERTFLAIASTGAPVRRNGYVEVLDVAGAHYEPGVPVLDSHRQDGLDRVLGVVTDWRAEAGKLLAKVKLSERASSIFADIRAGIIRGISLGYQVNAYVDTRGADGVLVRTARDWTIRELSLVAVGADPAALIRAERLSPQEENVMPDLPETTLVPESETRAQINREIRAIGHLSHLDQAWIDTQIDRGTTVEEARAAAFAAMAAKPQIRTATVGWSSDDPQARAGMIADALFSNVTGQEPSERARPFLHVRGPHDLCREALQMAGIRTTASSPADLVARALTTSDLPVLLTESVSRFVRAAYEEAPAALLGLARAITVPDFRAFKSIALHGPGRLARLYEHGEITYSHLDEEVQSAAVVSYARGLEISRVALINDDRSAFSTVATRLGAAARREEVLQACDLLALNSNAGPAMADGTYLFATAHANVAGSPAAPDEAHLSAARLAIRSQTDLHGIVIGLEPDTLVVPSALETTGQKLLTAVQATATSNANPFSNLRLVVEPRLSSATRYYLVASRADGLTIARLEGRAGPQVESETDFDRKSLKFTVINDFVPFFADWRGWFAHGVA